MNWYCRFEDRLLGPLTAAQLKALAEHGEIDDRWQVRREIDEQWRPATQVRGLSIRAAGANVDYFALLDTWSAELAAGVVPPEAVAGIPQTPPPAVAKPAESVPVDAATAAAAPPDIGPVAPDVVNRPAELSPPPELPPLPDLGLPTPPPAAASRSKLPPPLPRRAGPPPLPVRSTAPTGTAAPIPPAVPPPPAAVPSRPLSIAILGYAVLAIGFIALFSPAIAMIPAVESLSIERGVPNGLLVACGTVGGIAALVGGLGLLAGAGWSRRLLEALLVVELVCCLVVLPIGWFVATLVAAIVPLVLFYREPARAYFDRLSTAEPPEVPGWAFVGRWGLAGLNGALVIAAGVLRITHTPTPAEPTVAVRESRAEASSSSLPESGAPSGAPAVVGLPPKQPEQSKAEFTSFVFKRRNGNDVNEERPAVDPDSDQKPESADDLGEEYRAAAPVHGRLIGIEIMEGSASRPLHAVRPIFLTGDQETTGSSPAKWLGSSRTFKAKPGYAVGGMKAT